MLAIFTVQETETLDLGTEGRDVGSGKAYEHSSSPTVRAISLVVWSIGRLWVVPQL